MANSRELNLKYYLVMINLNVTTRGYQIGQCSSVGNVQGRWWWLSAVYMAGLASEVVSVSLSLAEWL